jgi:hypothetical protein
MLESRGLSAMMKRLAQGHQYKRVKEVGQQQDLIILTGAAAGQC